MTESYDDDNVFARILRKEIPADVLHEDDHCLAFVDVNPQAPTHVLVIPKQPITGLSETSREHAPLLGHLMWVVVKVARQLGVDDDGFRVVINDGARGGQAVPHLHAHLLSGRQMNWPPG